jgi:hypothetical protein
MRHVDNSHLTYGRRAHTLGEVEEEARVNNRGWGRSFRLAVAVFATVALGSLVAPPQVEASYPHQNPGLTPCGDGSNPVTLFRSYYLRDSSNLIWGLVEARYSAYCNSIWTRATNLRGSGTGYAPAADLYSNETIIVYNCPNTACQVDTMTDSNDHLPSKGSTGWSRQVDLPRGANLGTPASRQPAAFRSIVTLHAGSTYYTFDMGIEPLWDQLDNGFRNEPANRSHNELLTCRNGISRCASWGETKAGGYRTIAYYLDSSLDHPLHPATGVSVKADMRAIIGYWNVAAFHDPTFVECTAGLPLCLFAPLAVVLAPDTDLRVRGKLGVTIPDGVWDCANGPRYPTDDIKCGPTLALATYRIIVLNNDLVNFAHGCSDADTGCTAGDGRILLSHEMGHAEGLGECDMGFGAMCAVKAAGGNDMASGPRYFRPQWTDKQGLVAAYP